MRRIALALILALVVPATAFAHEYKLGSLLIDHPWTRATPQGAKVGGGYTVISNSGKADDRLVSAASDAAAEVQLHEMAVTDGVMSMRQLTQGVVIPAGGKVEFKPGGYHVMFIGLKAPLKQGDKVHARLVFEKAGPVDVDFEVGSIGQTAPSHEHNHTAN
eukprot:gene21883-22870_t